MPVPLIEEIVAAPDPARCCEQFEGLPFRIFLDSARPDARVGRYSFLSADPVALVRSKGARTECIDLLTGHSVPAGDDALETIARWLAPYAMDAAPDVPPFQGGAAGYVAYDWGRTLERLPAARYDDLDLPDVVFAMYDWTLAWDHGLGKAWLISTGIPEIDLPARARRAAGRAAMVKRWMGGGVPVSDRRAMMAPPGSSSAAPSFPVEHGWWNPLVELRSSLTHDAYLTRATRIREYIFAGDIFQANLSQRFEAPLTETPWSFYRRLRQQNAAPFAAFLDYPDAAILSASPERFLRVTPGGHVETRPIKGTAPRGIGPEHDAALGAALTESQKDRAENLMIVDLMRNDLSRVCAPGTVRVSELFSLERYATVQHLVSTIVGELAPGRSAADLLRAAFPGGSITGAPKVRSMEIIAELEPSARSIYCGAIGYWGLSGAFDTSIAIRTAIARAGRLYFNAGGGIVADSDPEREYRETFDKARGIIDALGVPR